MLVTKLGVAVVKVVATTEMPTSHQGAARREVKNSLVLLLARLQKKSAGRKLTAMLAPMMTQSSVAKWKGPFSTMERRVLWVDALRPGNCRRERYALRASAHRYSSVTRTGVVVAGESAVARFDPWQLCVFRRAMSKLRGLERSTPAHPDLRRYVVRGHDWTECDSHHVAGGTHPDRRWLACVCVKRRGKHPDIAVPRGGRATHREFSRALRSCGRHCRAATRVGRRGGGESGECAVDPVRQVVAG